MDYVLNGISIYFYFNCYIFIYYRRPFICDPSCDSTYIIVCNYYYENINL